MRISDWSSDVCSSDLPVDTLAELIAYAKAHPGEITFATSGIGSIQHIGTEQLSRHAGVEMLHIPYGGAGPAMNDMLGERADLIVTTPPAVDAHLQAGPVTALAIDSAERHTMLPHLPATAETRTTDFTPVTGFGPHPPTRPPA